MKIPLMNLADGFPDYRDALTEELKVQISNCNFIGGEAVGKFEEEWADYCRIPYAVGCSNGTDALCLTLRALGIGPGDSVVVPANSFIATAEAVCSVGAQPVFSDVLEESGLMDPADAERAIRAARNPAALIPVHLYGQMADMKAFLDMAERHNLKIIEDAAQAHGSSRDNLTPGSVSDAATFSFYPGKNLGAWGDAGAIVTRHADVAESLRLLRDHGRPPGEKYLHSVAGWNNRLDSLQATVLRHKLLHLEAWNAKRRALAFEYGTLLSGIPNLNLPHTHSDSNPVWYVYTVRCALRNELQTFLKDKGIASGIYFPIPLHRQPAFQTEDEALPVTEKLAGEILSLPLWPEMQPEDVRTVSDAVRSFLK